MTLKIQCIYNWWPDLTIIKGQIISSQITGSVIRHLLYCLTGIRQDSSLALPIRQTASIFKQPVTVKRIREESESKTKTDLKHGPQDQPKQVCTGLWVCKNKYYFCFS